MTMLIVELDGDSHLGQQERDEARERYLKGQGYEILRFENCEVMLSENAVVERIVWEVVPDLAEQIIRENLQDLTARKQSS